jgi:hypothetical protein
MIPNLALIITAYIIYRLIETTVSAFQRNKTSGVVLGVLAGICALFICSLAYDIIRAASRGGTGLSVP